MSYRWSRLKFYTTEEAKEALGLKAWQLKKLLNSSCLYAEKFDHRWLIPEPSIIAFRHVQAEREKIAREVKRLESILDDFLEKGDISKSYYDDAMKPLVEFIRDREGSKA